MKKWFRTLTHFLLLGIFSLMVHTTYAEQVSNPNLAVKAKVWASSTYSRGYSATNAVDGQIASPNSGDEGIAWCVLGEEAKGKATFILNWKEPVHIAEIVYFARTGSTYLDEGFKDAEVYVNEFPQPVAKVTFEPKHGAQRIILSYENLPGGKENPPRISKLRLEFLTDFGRPNSGAAEIMAFSKPTTDRDIELFLNPPPKSLDSFIAAGLPEEILFCTRKGSSDEHWYANIGYYADNVCHLPFPMGSGGGLYVYNRKTGKIRTILHDLKGNVRDPQLHYDGKKILFSYLPAGKKHYSLYEINLDGSNLRQITGVGEDTPLKLPEGVTPDTSSDWRMSAEKLGNRRDFSPPGWDDYEPTYLPDDSIIFCSTRAKRYVGCWLTHVGTLYKCAADGSGIRELSCNVEQDNTPWVLNNGQIAYMRWEYVDRSQVHYHHLWTMNPDGTRQMILYGNLHPGGVILAAKPIPNSGKIACIFSPAHGTAEHFGRVAVIDPRLGPDDPTGLQFITKGTNYDDVWAFDESHFLATARDRVVLIDERGQEQTLFHLPAELASQGFYLQEPRPVMKRQREPVLADLTDETKTTGTLAMVDLYKGRKMGDLPPGTVKELLILETLPKPIHYTGGTEMMSIFGTFMLERIVGTVPVSEEGSAYFELPAGRPFFFLAMDENGHCVKRMHSFTSVMPGENTVCIGCHEERTLPPDANDQNRLFKLLRTQPSQIKPVEGVPDVLCFTRDIQPILDRHCVECHNPDREEGGINLSGHWTPMYTISYANLTWGNNLLGDNRNRAVSNFAPYEMGTGSSRLVKLIEEGHQGVKMPPEEQKIIRMWIDVGANFAGTYAAEASGGVGYYMANIPVRNEKNWSETVAMREAIERRCDGCHAPTENEKKLGMYDIYRDNYSPRNPRTATDRFVAHDLAEGNGRFSRLEVFDLSYPEQSKVLTAPLSATPTEGTKGRGICEAASGKKVFESVNDPDYQAILRGIQRGRRYILEEDNRYSMLTPSPNNGPDCPTQFVPRWAYLREMIRYGILPIDTDPEASYDTYELDQKYWKSLWHTGNPK